MTSPSCAEKLCIEGVGLAFSDALQQLVHVHLAELKQQREDQENLACPQLVNPQNEERYSSRLETPHTPFALTQQVSQKQLPSSNSVESQASDSASLTESQLQLIKVFHILDRDSSGSLDASELRTALRVLKMPIARVGKILRMSDHNRTGEIDIKEWEKSITSPNFGGLQEIADIPHNFVEQVRAVLQGGNSEESSGRCMMLPGSPYRILWNILILVTCIFTAIEFPFVYAWQHDIVPPWKGTTKVIEYSVDVIFLVDILINFCTAYYDTRGKLISEHKKVATHYLKGWFFLDLLSTIPFDLIHPGAKSQVLKVLKLHKVLRLIRMMKVSDVAELVADFSLLQAHHLIQRRSPMVLYMVMVCHWMTCGMKAVDGGFLVDHFSWEASLWEEYLVALYWSLTTITTVGYGDITPTTKDEIVFVVFAMVVGGFFYAYVVGTIASMVANADLNRSAYFDRMEMVHAWSEHHNLPPSVKRKIRRYFKACLEHQSAADEPALWSMLTQELQIEVGRHVVNDNVSANPLFDRVSVGAIVKLQSVLKHVQMELDQQVTTAGDVGTCMFMIDTGELRGVRYIDKKSYSLGPGESFGEEIILGFREDYEYDVTAVERALLELIEESDFGEVFQCMPRVVERMRRNALLLNPEWGEEPNNVFRSQTTMLG